MTTITTELMKSLCTFTFASERAEILARRWWMDLSIAYLHKRGVMVENISNFSRALEEYVVGQIA